MYLHKGPYFQRGGSAGRRAVQRGRGLGSVFSSVFQKVLPALKIFKSHLSQSPLMREIGTSLRNHALQGVKQLAADAVAGRNVKAGINKSLEKARADIASTLEKRANEKREQAVAPKPPTDAANVSRGVQRRGQPTSLQRRRVPVKRIKKSVFEDVSDEGGGDDGGRA